MREIRTIVQGNACGEPERVEREGRPDGTKFRIAINSSYYDKDSGDWVERETTFVSVFAYGKLAENVRRSVHKGQALVVAGRLSISHWTKEDGGDGAAVTIFAEQIGHDLNFGTARFQRPPRHEEIPPMDQQTARPDPHASYTRDEDSVPDGVDVDTGEVSPLIAEGDRALAGAGESPF
jgi:single-strand DNA-binding protein